MEMAERRYRGAIHGLTDLLAALLPLPLATGRLVWRQPIELGQCRSVSEGESRKTQRTVSDNKQPSSRKQQEETAGPACPHELTDDPQDLIEFMSSL